MKYQLIGACIRVFRFHKMVCYTTIALSGIRTTEVAIIFVELAIITKIVFICLYEFVAMEIGVTVLWSHQLVASLTDKNKELTYTVMLTNIID